MPIAPNTPFDHYEIIAPLGAGGMGEVYRARDTRLDREVAIKVLPAEFAQEVDRLRRFEQEARATSALNHPNILTVYDFGTGSSASGGNPYLVMELLEGEELRAQLDTGALPVRRCIDYAQQIAAGLAAAHEKGIVHRDLKPENLFVTKDGRVKILDFGLAKLRPPRNAPTGSDVATQKQFTNPGTVMGTVAYMSPEQVRGQDLEQRSDIFSFGLILYEMLAGQRAFTGESQAETMSAIAKEEPRDLSELNSKVTPQLEKIVRRCLEKKPERRFQTASDLGFALEALSTPSSSGKHRTEAVQALDTATLTKRSGWRDRIAWLAAAALLLTTLGFAWAYFTRQPITNEARMLKFSITPPENASFDSIALSPDGRWLAFTAATGGKVQLWVRALDATEAKVLPGTEGARYPFWSPDSHWIAFFAATKLKKIEVSGGPAQSLCDLVTAIGGAWSRDGVILFSRSGMVGLSRVSATGGEATVLTTPDRTRQEIAHHHPFFLPDGQHFLFAIASGQKETRGIYLGSLDGKLKQRLLSDFSSAVYAPPGYLLFRRDETLLAQPFDADKRQLSGEPFPVAERVGREPQYGRAKVSVSDNGVLVLDPHVNRQSKKLFWLDRGGKQTNSLNDWVAVSSPWLAPDEKRFVVERADANGTYDLWLVDASGANPTRFTFDPGHDYMSVWSPDGQRIVWASTREEGFRMYQKAASGAGQEEPLFNINGIPTDWSRDGRFIIYNRIISNTKSDVWVLPLDGAQKPFPFLQTEATEGGGQLSPDGRWLAYDSDESGRFEVYVQRFPSGGGQRQISTNGGMGPRWRRDGKELFYYAADGKLMAMPVGGGENFEPGAAVALFEFRSGGTSPTIAPYTVTGDGQRFLVNAIVDAEPRAPLTVVVNWAAGAKK